MNQKALWQISVKTVPEGEDAVTEALGRIFGRPASSYTESETAQTTVSAYLAEKPNPSARAEVVAALKRIKSFGVNLGPAPLRLAKVLRQDWAESWKRHFRPLQIGSALLIKPSWSKRRPKKGQATILLDPGLSFGTGQHPTTSFCLQQLAAHRHHGAAQSVLDLGTGSGILAIAAAKLGYQPVHAVDLDAQAIRIARANARRNRESRRIRFLKQDLTKLPSQPVGKYAIVCANLISSLLLAERNRILTRLRGDGVLIVAGILKVEFGKVRKAYETAGMRLLTSHAEKEWRSATFRWGWNNGIMNDGNGTAQSAAELTSLKFFE